MPITTAFNHTADLDKGAANVLLRQPLSTLDANAHAFVVEVKRGSESADLTGARCEGWFVRADGVTVPIDGEVAGSTATVTLLPACYAVPGRFALAVKLALGDVIHTILRAEGSIDVSRTDALTEGGTGVQSFDEILKQLENAHTPAGLAAAVTDYGAKGDGVTDDTAAFAAALAENRRVLVPGGEYKLTGELTIRDGCQLELVQDAVLRFAQTSGSCITVNRSSWLRGNHATIFVPYSFSGKVINADTTAHASTKDVPPWTHWDPQWKTARYVTDVNICKVDGYGLHHSTSGDSAGTAVYISATGGATSTFMWGVNLSGLRIAGAFEYGIRAQNFSAGWNHEMRVEAFVDACKIGVSLEDCNNAYICAAVQPRKAGNGAVYAKHGIQLIRCENTDMLGTRVWDWNDKNSLWTFDKGNINQHIAMYGDCTGTILNDYNYHYLPSSFDDIRELIYTDTPKNFESLIIIQEPIDKWYMVKDSMPYFDNGDGVKQRLALKAEQDALFQTDYIPTFTDRLASAIDGDGAVFNGFGYKIGCYWNTDGKTLVDNDPYHTATGMIRCKKGSVIRVKGMSFAVPNAAAGFQKAVVYDAGGKRLMHVNRENLVSNASYYFFDDYTPDDDGFTVKVTADNAAYVTFSVATATVGSHPVVAVDEEIAYTQAGFLADTIFVREQSLQGMEGYERKSRMVTAITGASTDDQYPSAKAVYDAMQSALGAYINDIAALIGGGA